MLPVNKEATVFLICVLGLFSLGLSGPTDGVFKSLEKAMAQPEAVIELRLKRKKIQKLPPEIGQLTHLKVLDLRKNQLTELPESLKELPNLEVLLLGKNKFTAIPPVIFQCKQLKELSVSSNKISSLPAAIQELQQLNYLDFFDTYLELLPIAALQNMPSLKKIDLRRTFVFTPEAKAYGEVLPNVTLLSNPGCDCNNPKKKISQKQP